MTAWVVVLLVGPVIGLFVATSKRAKRLREEAHLDAAHHYRLHDPWLDHHTDL